MKVYVRLAIGAVLVCAVAYLAWLNPANVEVHLAPGHTLPAMQLGVVLVAAFLAGLLAVLAGLLYLAFRGYLSPAMLIEFANSFYC